MGENNRYSSRHKSYDRNTGSSDVIVLLFECTPLIGKVNRIAAKGDNDSGCNTQVPRLINGRQKRM